MKERETRKYKNSDKGKEKEEKKKRIR